MRVLLAGSGWGIKEGGGRGRRFKRPRRKDWRRVRGRPLPSRLKMRVAGQSPTHGQSEARRGITAPACKRPPSANGRPARAYRGRHVPLEPPKESCLWPRQRYSEPTKACFFCRSCSCRGFKVEIGPHFCFVFFIPRWPCRPSPVPGCCREMPSPPYPPNGQPSRPNSAGLVLSSQALTCPWLHGEALDQPGRDCDGPLSRFPFLPTGKMATCLLDGLHRQVRDPGRGQSIPHRALGRLGLDSCRLGGDGSINAWPSIKTWLRGNLGEEGGRTERDGPSSVLFFSWKPPPRVDNHFTTSQEKIPGSMDHDDCILTLKVHGTLMAL
ncbi:hypothetical protein QBC39DRAFT_145803 [Podospora conica]|nr:hypothetical protein QBC39DRAFT_145803 [Schizothecium conicum]